MRYKGKKYTREPAPLFRSWEGIWLFRSWEGTWEGICTGRAFRDDADMCIETCNKDDLEKGAIKEF